MKIGDLGLATHTKVETIRYYERIGLLPPPARTASNYRHYTDAHRQRLNFIRHARGLGFVIAEIRSLLDLADDPERDCSEADRIASEHLRTVEEKIARLGALRDELARVVGVCRGGQVASCRVLEALGEHSLCATPHAHDTLDAPVMISARRSPAGTRVSVPSRSRSMGESKQAG
jgi:DNA-binding transcriptional MerR regulator